MIRTHLKRISLWILVITFSLEIIATNVKKLPDFVHDDNDDDTVVIDAEPLENLNRKQRQVTSWAEALGEGGPCLTSAGILGACTSYRSCFPYYKQRDVGIWEAWALGNYDQCSYFNYVGHQVFGVCCTNQLGPTIPTDENNMASNNPDIIDQEPGNIKDITYQHWPPQAPTHSTTTTQSTTKQPTTALQWPPQIPTHPPNHHAPTHARPVQDPTTTRRTTRRPDSTTTSPWWTKPPSTSTTAWWMTTTTKPPSTTTSPWWTSSTKWTTKPTTSRPHYPTTAKPDNNFQTSCGAKNGFLDQERIVGGQNASPNEWPWMVVLFNSGRQFCGGSLIDDIHILTAAHCVSQMTSWDVARLTAHLGDHNIKTTAEIHHVERRIQRVIRHKGFDSRTLYNDVAVLRMDKPVQFSTVIRSICLPSISGKGYSGLTGTVAGWGSLRENGPQPSILQKVSVPIWSNQECASKYGHAAPGGIIESMLCAGVAAKDSCSGDSGGPLMVNEGRWVQVGIVSWGIGCGKGQYPGVYTRVSSFLPWIAKNIKS